MNSGTRSFMGEVLSWGVVALIGVYAIVNYEELKALTAATLGIEKPTLADNEGAAASLQSEDNSDLSAGSGSVRLKAGSNGHFHTEADVNGHTIEVMVDTGATIVALTEEDAERAGIYLKDSDFTHRVSTANGVARVAPVTLGRVTIGDITVRNVDAAVCERGKLTTTLLGMSFLSKLDRFEMRAGELVLEN